MPKPVLTYVALLGLLGLVAYNSVYVRKLDGMKAGPGSNPAGPFDAGTYASTFWTGKLLPSIRQQTGSVQALSTLLPLLKSDPQQAFSAYSHALGIGPIRYFLVKGSGNITAIHENDITVSLDKGGTVRLATEFIFGNAIRDASGLIKITDVDNTAALNSVSEALNTLVRTRVIPPLKASAKTGSPVNFVGAIELNTAHLHLDNLEVMPISVAVNP